MGDVGAIHDFVGHSFEGISYYRIVRAHPNVLNSLSFSISSWDEAGNPSLYYGIKAVLCLDSLINFLHGPFRQAGNFEVFPDMGAVC